MYNNIVKNYLHKMRSGPEFNARRNRYPKKLERAELMYEVLLKMEKWKNGKTFLYS